MASVQEVERQHRLRKCQRCTQGRDRGRVLSTCCDQVFALPNNYQEEEADDCHDEDDDGYHGGHDEDGNEF